MNCCLPLLRYRGNCAFSKSKSKTRSDRYWWTCGTGFFKSDSPRNQDIDLLLRHPGAFLWTSQSSRSLDLLPDPNKLSSFRKEDHALSSSGERVSAVCKRTTCLCSCQALGSHSNSVTTLLYTKPRQILLPFSGQSSHSQEQGSYTCCPRLNKVIPDDVSFWSLPSQASFWNSISSSLLLVIASLPLLHGMSSTPTQNLPK